MPAHKVSEILAELVECRDLVRQVKRHIDCFTGREALYSLDTRLGQVMKDLEDSIRGCESDDSQPTADN
jgi:3-methyladenine DNA glycosylase Tag